MIILTYEKGMNEGANKEYRFEFGKIERIPEKLNHERCTSQYQY